MFEIKDILVILATLCSPLIAVQVTKWLERRKAVRDDRMAVFKTLMATRHLVLDPRRVEAFNVIDVVFSGSSRKESEIRDFWKQYLDLLNSREYSASPEVWLSRCNEYFIDLLYAMAVFLDYKFDKTHLKNQVYYPKGHVDFENDNFNNRAMIGEMLRGERPLSIKIVPPPETELKGNPSK